METRKDFPRPGMLCWAIAAPEEPLPPGLADRAPVTVIRTGSKPQCVTVQDAAGSQWNLAPWQLDCGWLFQPVGREEWLPESDPAIQEHLVALLEKARASSQPVIFGSDHHRLSIGDLEWLVQRGGHAVI